MTIVNLISKVLYYQIRDLEFEVRTPYISKYIFILINDKEQMIQMNCIQEWVSISLIRKISVFK